MDKAKRLSNFELLRIISMFLIIGFHLTYHGVQYVWADTRAYELFAQGTLANKIASSVLLPGGEIGVALFFLITGYFYIEKKTSSVRRVVLECMFYSIFSILLYVISYLTYGSFEGVKITEIAKFIFSAVFNPASGIWWFASAYILLLLISPLLNKALHKLNRKGYVLLLFLFWFLWYTVASSYESIFYDFQRAVFFYIVGAFIRLFCEAKSDAKSRLIFICLILIFAVVSVMLCYFFSDLCTHSGLSIEYKLIRKMLKVGFTSVCVPVVTVSLFRLFEGIKMGTNMVINTIAQTVFGVYLIHDSLVGRHFIWYKLLKIDRLFLEQKVFPLLLVPIILGVFVGCAVIDLLRIQFVEKWALDKSKLLMARIRKNCLKDEE